MPCIAILPIDSAIQVIWGVWGTIIEDLPQFVILMVSDMCMCMSEHMLLCMSEIAG